MIEILHFDMLLGAFFALLLLYKVHFCYNIDEDKYDIKRTSSI